MKVKQAIGRFSPEVRKFLNTFFERKIKLYDKHDFGITSEIIGFTQNYTLAEITQPRPALVIIGYAASGNKITKDIIKASIFTTFITKYLAIHDDIIDLDEIKNGVPTVHVQGRKFNGSDKMGNDLAILAGDFLWSWAIEVILDSPYPIEMKMEALKVINNANELTNVGQVMDLDFVMRNLEDMKNEEVWSMYTNKAAIYCYAQPLMVGAILGGSSPILVDKLGEYAKLVGAASQLRDDLEGVFGTEEETGKSDIVDLRMGVKSLLAVKGFELADEQQRTTLKRFIGKTDLNQSQAEEVRAVISKVEARDYCEKMLRERGLEALRILEEIKDEINEDSWEYLDDLVRFRLGIE